MKSQVTPKSHERYAGIVNQNLIPALGAVQLAKLKPAQISEAYSKALANGRRDGKPAASPHAPSDTCTAFLSRRSGRPSAGNC